MQVPRPSAGMMVAVIALVPVVLTVTCRIASPMLDERRKHDQQIYRTDH